MPLFIAWSLSCGYQASIDVFLKDVRSKDVQTELCSHPRVEPAAGEVYGLDYAGAPFLHRGDSECSTGLALAVILPAIWTSYLVHPL